MNARRLVAAVVVVSSIVLIARVRADEPPFRAAPETPFLIEHIALDLDVDVAGKSVAATAALDVKAVRDLEALKLNAVGLEVKDVRTKDASGAQAPFTADGESLEVRLPLKRGEQQKIVVTYAIRSPKTGLHFYGPSPKEPDVPLQVWSQGEARTNRYWFPCIDEPVFKQTSEIVIRVPQGFEALSNGELVSRKDEGQKTVFHWSQKKPHVAYLLMFVVGKFHVGKDEWRGKPVLYYVNPKHKDDVERSFGDTKAMLDFFSDRIGVEYAWAKYAQVCVEQFGLGGMENTSATTLNERTLHDARAHLDYDSDGLVAHELAHQWWGDLLTCRDWAHIWLNEGFASYFEALWDEKKNGADAFEYNMFEKGNAAREGNCRTRPVVDHHYADAENVFDNRAYPKGAWILHGLRRRVGDEAFWRAINRYCKGHAYQTVETVDLRRAFEEETGDSLERYFNDWSERPAHPAIEVRYDWNDKDKLLEAQIRQTQQEGAFAFRAALVASTGKPQEGQRIVVTMDEKEKRLVIPMKARPRYVHFDVDEAVLKELTENKGDDQWLVQIAEDPNAVGRIRAAQVLAEKRFPQGFEAVGKALLEDAFWGVSIECARALGKVGGDAARDALLKGLSHKNPKVRRACVDALAGYRLDAKVIAALKPIVEKGDASYYVESSAVSAYAKVRADDARAWLEKALERPSHNEVIREAALSSLAELEDPSALPILEKTANGPGEPGVRRTAIAALARVAALPTVDDETRRKVVVRLMKFVDEEGFRLRLAAVEALSAIGKDAAPALASLEAVMRHDPETRVRDAAKGAVDRIHAGTPPNLEISRLKDEVQRLKENEEKLLKRIDEVEAKFRGNGAPADAPSPGKPMPSPKPSEQQPY